jgi:hypothetical protein
MSSRLILLGTVVIAALAGAGVGLVGGHAINKGKSPAKALSAVPAADVHTIATKIPDLRSVALPASLRAAATSKTSNPVRKDTTTASERSSTSTETASHVVSTPARTTKVPTKSDGPKEESGGA